MRVAFTLAEVLITLGIIGIVAAMTLPALIQNYNEKVTVAKLKKLNSILNNAFLSAVNEYGTPDTWNILGRPSGDNEDDALAYTNSVDNVMKKFLPYLKTTFVCFQSDTSCNENEKYKRNRYSLDGTHYGTWETPRMILADGASIDTIYFGESNCTANWGTSKALQNTCGEIVVDVNGIKPPNAQGKDIFFFYMTKYGIIPSGVEADRIRPFKDYCQMNKPSNHNGYGCTAWVIYNENMDYTRCNDLSLNGKRSCSGK